MSSTSAATTSPAFVQLPSGDTSDEGNTAGTDGQGGQATSSPGAAGPQDTSSSGGKDNSKDDVGEEPSAAGSPRSGTLNGPRSDSAVDSRQTRAIGTTNSVGTQTADAMVTRFLTEPEARRLETDNLLPSPEFGPRGEVVAPTRCDFSMDPSSLGRTRLVEELDHADLLDLQEFFPEEGPPVADLVLRSHTEAIPGEELMFALQSLPVQREMAALLSEYGAENLAERTFATVSLVRRILNRYRRVCRQLNASAYR
ncbi:hypothetical protein PF005_g26993 [Phytophthora fragariae]|uniref:Uncharacterized protein n=1 Tax=Phytophthora fragariae TaxID=53985 RepID=A0A6A3HXC1_9STRA|nr:hypothetical protein PF011_g25637 [Phytophthora fragariae]KAE9171797.1 hypothetical protein PF005_g26993 [Phytophthora fragariae]